MPAAHTSVLCTNRHGKSCNAANMSISLAHTTTGRALLTSNADLVLAQDLGDLPSSTQSPIPLSSHVFLLNPGLCAVLAASTS